MPRFQIQTERLIIRDFFPDDWEATHRYAHRLENIEYMIWGPNTPEQTRDFIQRCIFQQREDPRTGFELALVLEETDQLIGSCGMRVMAENRHRGDLGYILHSDYWGKGLATEATLALIRHFALEYGLSEVQATCDVRNIASQRVMEKCGLHRVKLKKADKTETGRVRDTYLYEKILKET